MAPKPNLGLRENSTVVTIRCPKPFAAKLKKLAAADHRTVSSYVLHVLAEHIKTL